MDDTFELRRALSFQWMCQLAIDDLPDNAIEANNKLQNEPWITAALASNMILTAELLLKLNLRINEKPVPEHHNIRRLFNKLDAKEQSAIEARFDQKLSEIPDSNLVIVGFKSGSEKAAVNEFGKITSVANYRILETVLKSCGETYTFWRYFSGQMTAIFPLSPLSCLSPALAEHAHSRMSA